MKRTVPVNSISRILTCAKLLKWQKNNIAMQGVAKLERLVLECQTIEKRIPSLDDLISSITSKLRENEQQINETKHKYNWSKGVSEMENE